MDRVGERPISGQVREHSRSLSGAADRPGGDSQPPAKCKPELAIDTRIKLSLGPNDHGNNPMIVTQLITKAPTQTVR